MPSIPTFITQLTHYHLPSVFNPWSDYDPDLDIGPAAPAIRRDQLQQYLKLRQGRARYLFLAEAVGYQGGRFSGIPITSERILLGFHDQVRSEDVISGPCRRTSRPDCPSLNPSEQAKGMAEPTATIVWGTLLAHGLKPEEFVFWNIFPFHPYKSKSPGKTLSNRTPTAAELACGAEIFHHFHALFPAVQIFAVGAKASQTLAELNILFFHLPHPANGHANQFRETVDKQVGRV
ncbi:MAG TPA: hypothetical protein DDW50_21530 [Firmicutes bacterium]|jgi:hypothetical protein|nr:hypothetical protein [Bacillota bacterium]